MNPAIDKYGTKRWYNDDLQLHREGKPAIEYPSGVKRWYRNGNLYRDDGPAVEYPSGYKEYWLNGKKLDDNQILLMVGDK